MVSFFLEKLYIPHYRWITCYVCARLCQCFVQNGCYFGCDKPCRLPATTPAHNVFCYSAVAHILTHSVHLAFRP